MKTVLTWGSVVLGIFFIGLAVYYWRTPAGLLPSYLPGYLAGSAHAHFKHGLASLILGLFLFIVAWFNSAPKKSVQ